MNTTPLAIFLNTTKEVAVMADGQGERLVFSQSFRVFFVGISGGNQDKGSPVLQIYNLLYNIYIYIINKNVSQKTFCILMVVIITIIT